MKIYLKYNLLFYLNFFSRKGIDLGTSWSKMYHCYLCENTRTFFKVELKIMFYFLNWSNRRLPNKQVQSQYYFRNSLKKRNTNLKIMTYSFNNYNSTVTVIEAITRDFYLMLFKRIKNVMIYAKKLYAIKIIFKLGWTFSVWQFRDYPVSKLFVIKDNTIAFAIFRFNILFLAK